MNEGVQILLERMKTHPEEFVAEAQYGVSKWGQAIQHLQDYLPKEDKEALETAWKQTVSDEMQRRFTQAVMEELIDPKSETNPYLTSNTVTGGQTQGQAWVNSQLQQAQATQAHIQLHQQQLAIQAAQQATNPYNNLGSATQGYLSSLFGGKK